MPMTVTITNVMAISLDGTIGRHALESDQERRSYGFTNSDDQEHVRSLLSEADAVITGANSLRASGSTWKLKNDCGVNPAWIVFTKSGLHESLEFWRQKDVRRILVSPTPVQENLCKRYGVENWILSEAEVPRLKSLLEQQGLRRVLLFGGGMINKIFYENDLVDFAKITICPLVIAAHSSPRFVNSHMKAPVSLRLVSSVLKGDLVFLTYEIKR